MESYCGVRHPTIFKMNLLIKLVRSVKIFNYPATVKPDDVGTDKCKANDMITS